MKKILQCVKILCVLKEGIHEFNQRDEKSAKCVIIVNLGAIL